MNKYIIIFLTFFVFVGANAQFVNDYGGIRSGFLITKPRVLDKVQGTPYLDETFKRGEILFEGKKPVKIYIRYNVLNDVMEMKMELEETEIYEFSSKEEVKYKIGERIYVQDEIIYQDGKISGYFGELYNGDSIRLLMKASASVSEPVPAKSSYEVDKPSRISIDETYFIILDNGRIEEVGLSRRDIRKIFESKEVKNYLSDNKIKTVEDLVAFVEFYDNLK